MDEFLLQQYQNSIKKDLEAVQELMGIPVASISAPASKKVGTIESLLKTSNHFNVKWRDLQNLEEGTFVQSRLRELDSKYPPPIFYVGKLIMVQRGNPIHDSINIEAVRNMLCLHSLKWNSFNILSFVLSVTPEVTNQQRFSVLPFLEEEPSGTPGWDTWC